MGKDQVLPVTSKLRRTRMKKILALIAALMFVIPVAACSSDSTPAPVQTVTAPAPAPYEAPAVSTDDRYLNAVRGQSAVLYSVPDATLVELAGTICDGLRAGIPIETVLQIGIDSGLDSTSVAAIAAGAVVFYCPGADERTSGA
jgi:hypothetical protein